MEQSDELFEARRENARLRQAISALESELLLERLEHSRTKAELQEARDEAQNDAWERAEARDMAQDD